MKRVYCVWMLTAILTVMVNEASANKMKCRKKRLPTNPVSGYGMSPPSKAVPQGFIHPSPPPSPPVVAAPPVVPQQPIAREQPKLPQVARNPVKDTTKTEEPIVPLPTPTPTPSTPGLSQADADGLAAHNEARAQQGVAPLQWDPQLASQAAQYGTRLSGKGCSLVHSGMKGIGENLWATYGTRSGSIRSAVDSWMQEDYSPGVLNHHSQVMWSRSTHVGCALVSGSHCATVVCQYSPPGNFVGQSAY